MVKKQSPSRVPLTPTGQNSTVHHRTAQHTTDPRHKGYFYNDGATNQERTQKAAVYYRFWSCRRVQ